MGMIIEQLSYENSDLQSNKPLVESYRLALGAKSIRFAENDEGAKYAQAVFEGDEE